MCQEICFTGRSIIRYQISVVSCTNWEKPKTLFLFYSYWNKETSHYWYMDNILRSTYYKDSKTKWCIIKVRWTYIQCSGYLEWWWLDSTLHLVLFIQFILNSVSVAYICIIFVVVNSCQVVVIPDQCGQNIVYNMYMLPYLQKLTIWNEIWYPGRSIIKLLQISVVSSTNLIFVSSMWLVFTDHI